MCSASTPAAVGFARSIAHPPITNGWLVMTAFASGASIPTSAFGAGIVTAADCAVHALVTVLSAYATTVYVPAARCVVDIVNDAYPNRAPNAAAMSARYAPYGAAPRKIGSPPAHGYAHTCTVLTPLPLAAARSTAHPPITNGLPTVAPCAGTSSTIRGSVPTVTVVLRVKNAPVTVLRALTSIRQVPPDRLADDRPHPDGANRASPYAVPTSGRLPP